MNSPVRNFLFAYYWMFAAPLLLIGVPLILLFSRPDTATTSAIALCAAVLSAVYFVQKQKIEELQLFERLFTQFNTRYADMHAGLQGILATHISPQGDSTPLGRIEREILDNYFNLCAEEYLFYTEGRILRQVWVAWCRGMCDYLAIERIRSHWAEQLRPGCNSHYGLTPEFVELAAGQME